MHSIPVQRPGRTRQPCCEHLWLGCGCHRRFLSGDHNRNVSALLTTLTLLNAIDGRRDSERFIARKVKGMEFDECRPANCQRACLVERDGIDSMASTTRIARLASGPSVIVCAVG
jgi:hypothetical protein